MLVMPYYLLPFFPIVFAPIFISLSDLSPKLKILYSLYPLALFILVYMVFHHRTTIPRKITFEGKGWHTIIYNVKNEMKLKDKNGYREINFSKEPILLTSTKQMDVIPVSDSRYFYKDAKDQITKIIFNSDIQYKANIKDTSLYIYYEVPELDSTYCFFLQNESISVESFFIGSIEEYFNRDSIYPIKERKNKSNQFFKTYCNTEEK
jgi:hypothetical protein